MISIVLLYFFIFPNHTLSFLSPFPPASPQLQSVEETLCEVRDQLSRSGVVNSDLAVPLFDSLLRVALAQVSSCPDAPEEKPDRVSLPWETQQPFHPDPMKVAYGWSSVCEQCMLRTVPAHVNSIKL